MENTTVPKEKLKLVFWNNGFVTVDQNNKSNKKEEFYIFKAIKRFEAAYPNITVEVKILPAATRYSPIPDGQHRQERT